MNKNLENKPDGAEATLSENQKLELFQVEELEDRFELATWIGTANVGCGTNGGCPSA